MEKGTKNWAYEKQIELHSEMIGKQCKEKDGGTNKEGVSESPFTGGE